MLHGLMLRVLNVLVVAVVLTGCTTGGTKTPVPNSSSRPSLVIPKTFTSEAAKYDFAANAVLGGYYAEAKPLLEQTVSVSPNGKAYSLLGTTAYNLSDYSGAIDAWSRAAELDSELAGQMQNNIGNALRDSGKATEAKAAYRKALELEPARWTAAVNLASILKDEGKTREAVHILDVAIHENKNINQLTELRDSYRLELKDN